MLCRGGTSCGNVHQSNGHNTCQLEHGYVEKNKAKRLINSKELVIQDFHQYAMDRGCDQVWNLLAFVKCLDDSLIMWAPNAAMIISAMVKRVAKHINIKVVAQISRYPHHGNA
jgi:hypothetical protein